MPYSDGDNSGVYAIVSYASKLVEQNLDISKSDYPSSYFIIPTSQQPEWLATGRPFIVYGSATQRPVEPYEVETASIVFNVYSTSVTEANNISAVLAQGLSRLDQSAKDVNAWVDLEGKPGNRPAGRRNVSFTSISLNLVAKAEPADGEGEYLSAMVMIEASYIVTSDDITTEIVSY